ncbi:MAG: FAD-dependent oxidoreductase [Polyangia bacterium]
MHAELPNEVDVVLIGGGLAGLTCAVVLAERGVRVAVLERDRRLGGRAQSYRDQQTADPVHLGPHILLSAYPNMRALLRRLGTEDRIRWMDERFISLVEGTSCYPVTSDPRLPPPLHFLPSFRVAPGLSRRDLLSNARVVWTALRLGASELAALDDEIALSWLRRMGVTEAAIERSWSFIALSILNVPLELCSAGALLRFFRRLIGHNDIRIGLPTCGLGDLFAPQAEALLRARQSVAATDVTVQSILTDGPRAVGVRLADGRTIKARWVVSTVPPANLRPLIPEAWQSARIFTDLVHFVPCPYISTCLWFDGKLSDHAFWARLPAPGDFNCDFYDLSNLPPGWPTDRSIITSNIIWSHRAAELTDAQIIAQTRRELAEFLPAAATTPLRHAVVHRIPLAVHCPFPGIERRRPDPVTPFAGLLVAGDWVKTGVPASMEGACRSGHLAAQAILESRGEPVKLVHDVPEFTGISRLIVEVSRALRHAP